jgi:hypothetical protein
MEAAAAIVGRTATLLPLAATWQILAAATAVFMVVVAAPVGMSPVPGQTAQFVLFGQGAQV